MAEKDKIILIDTKDKTDEEFDKEITEVLTDLLGPEDERDIPKKDNNDK